MKVKGKLPLIILATFIIPTISVLSQEEVASFPVYLDRGPISDYTPNSGIAFRGIRKSVFYRLVIEPESGEKQKKSNSKIFLGKVYPETKTRITIYRDTFYAGSEYIRASAKKGAKPGLKATQEVSKAAKEDPIAAIGYVFTVPLTAVGAVTGGVKGLLTSRINPQESKEIASLYLDSGTNNVKIKDAYNAHHYDIELDLKKIDNSHYSIRFTTTKTD